MIPLILHQIWLGGRPVPRWQDAWVEMYSTWDYHLWDEADARRLLAGSFVLAPAFDSFMSSHDYPGAADVLRIALLEAYGGVYVDIDAIPLRNFDEGPFMRDRFFAAYEPVERDLLAGRIANGTLGSEPQHPIWGTYTRIIAEMQTCGGRISPAWDTVGGTALTAAVLTHRRCCRPRILPASTFYPMNSRREHTLGAMGRPFTDHLWASTNKAYPKER